MSEQNPVPDEQTPLLTSDSPEPEAPEETMSSQTFWRIGALYGAAAVGLGAFGAHGLRNRLPADSPKLQSWATAAQYQLLHSAVLLVARGNPVASTLFTAGITLFSGSIYALVLDPQTFKFLGPTTPVGGLFLIAGWIALGFGGPGAARFAGRWSRF